MSDTRTDPQYKLRLPADLKARIEEAAEANKRSMNAEIVARIERSFSRTGEGIVRKQYEEMSKDEMREVAADAAIILMEGFRAATAAAVAGGPLNYQHVLMKYYSDLSGIYRADDPAEAFKKLRGRIVHAGHSKEKSSTS